MCRKKEERGPRREVVREEDEEEEEEKVARVVVKEEEEVEMKQQARGKLERKRELSQLKEEKWLRAMLEVVAVDREPGRKRKTRRRTTKIETKKVEEGWKDHSRYLKIRSPTRMTEMTHSQRPTKKTARTH